jgi:hypothetical protein
LNALQLGASDENSEATSVWAYAPQDL